MAFKYIYICMYVCIYIIVYHVFAGVSVREDACVWETSSGVRFSVDYLLPEIFMY